ncbi:hypothetical protein C0995_011349 [Termitomyces sp. Mi166|nr:hypothetical protein C0995_011349 [Termitomyces sp. Mi166\
MAQVLREPVNIVSKYLRSSPTRTRPPGSPKRHHRTFTSPHLAKFHDIRATREEQEESESDIEVSGPFPVLNTLDVKGKARTAAAVGASVKAINDPENSTAFKSHHPLFLKDTMGETSISAPRVKKPASGRKTVSTTSTSSSTSSRTLSATSLSKQTKRSAAKLAKSASTASVASVESEPPADFPIYSYKDYTETKPYVVYTRDVEEADDLIAGLKPGPVAFDMEWCFSINQFWKKERRTAVVQVADSAGFSERVAGGIRESEDPEVGCQYTE